MMLAGLQSAVAAVLFGITVKDHSVFPRWYAESIIDVGNGAVKVKHKEKSGPFKRDDLVVRVLV